MNGFNSITDFVSKQYQDYQVKISVNLINKNFNSIALASIDYEVLVQTELNFID